MLKSIFFAALGLTMTASVAYADNTQPTSQRPNTQGNPSGRTREEIALRDNDDRQLYNQQMYRGSWDYRDNWRYNRDAYLSGMNQSQFDDYLYPRYGYGPYSYPTNYYSRSASGSLMYPGGTSYYGPTYAPNYAATPNYAVTPSQSLQYGYQTVYPSSTSTNLYGSYPQQGAATYTYGAYPQPGLSTYTNTYPQYGYGYQSIYPTTYTTTYPQYRNQSIYPTNSYYTNLPSTASMPSTSRNVSSYSYYNTQPGNTYGSPSGTGSYYYSQY